MEAMMNKRSSSLAPASGGATNGGDGGDPVQALLVELLGGFRVERIGVAQPVLWQRRSARTLTKLLATHPRHAMHREQILELLWPGIDAESALNRFGQALHAARRAFEPELLPRESSAYLRMTESMLALVADRVVIDADRFQVLAENALGTGDVAGYETALAAYGGELLPEDRYQDWCADRRAFLSELNTQLKLELADALKERADFRAFADLLQEVLQEDPTREDVHRRLILLYAEMGTRNKAVRQFQICREVLRQELGLVPEEATLALYQDVLAGRIPTRAVPAAPDRVAIEPDQVPGEGQPVSTGFVGRDSILRKLRGQLARAHQGEGHLILVSGEAGVGKTRLAWELAVEAHRSGASVLWGGTGGHANLLAYGPFAVALEGYVRELSDRERAEVAQNHPALVPLVPSLGLKADPSALTDPPAEDSLYLVHDIVRFLTDLARGRTVLLVLGELQDLDAHSLKLLQYLAHLAVQRRWLIVGTFREDGFPPSSDLRRMIEESSSESLCLHIRLQGLTREECDKLVRAMLGGGSADEAVIDLIWQLSLGNPMFAEALLGAMLARGELRLTNGSWSATPGSPARVPLRVRSLVAMQVTSMPADVRRVLELAAVGGEIEISLSRLQAAAAALEPPLSDAALFEALDRALDAYILEERLGIYSFRHPLVRSALYEYLSKHRRDQLRAALDKDHA